MIDRKIIYDDRGNVIYEKNSNCEHWYKYDENNNNIHWRRSDGHELWQYYDKNNRVIHCKIISGKEWWYRYDRSGTCIDITKEILEKIEFLSREFISRFELMEL